MVKRMGFIDVAKGIGILLVILGHIIGDGIIFKSIYAFHMPLFFIIAGYVYNVEKYNDYKFIDFVKRKFKNYIIPYFKISIICFAIFGVVINYFKLGLSNDYFSTLLKYLFGIIYSIGTLEYMPNCSPIWFLTCLFCTEILFYFIYKHANKKTIWIFVCFLLGIILNKVKITNLLWNIDIALLVLPFMYLGLIIKQYNFLEKYKEVYTILFIGIFIFSVNFNTAINFNARNLGNILFTYLGAISMSMIILHYSKYLEKSKILKLFGENTMFVMGYNYAINYLYLGYFYMFTFIDCWEVKFINITIMTGLFILIRNKINNIKAKYTV